MMRGRFLHVERLSMQGLLYSKGYSACGVEMRWPPMALQGNSARMAASDDYAEKLAELTFSICEQHARRNMTFSHGLPRRQVCLCDDGLGPAFLAELKADLGIHEALGELGFEGHELYMKRSVFGHVGVKQLVGCLEEEGWTITPRTPQGFNLSNPSVLDRLWVVSFCLVQLGSLRLRGRASKASLAVLLPWGRRLRQVASQGESRARPLLGAPWLGRCSFRARGASDSFAPSAA